MRLARHRRIDDNVPCATIGGMTAALWRARARSVSDCHSMPGPDAARIRVPHIARQLVTGRPARIAA